MTNLEKRELYDYCKRGYTFKKIRKLVDCSDATIYRYLKVFAPISSESAPITPERKEKI